MNLVWHSTLEGSSKRFALLALADSANDQGRVLKLGIPTLCRKTGIKRSAMFTVLKQLEEDDQLIRREERTGAAGERRTSRFWINLPALRAMQLPDDDQTEAGDPSNPFISAGQPPVRNLDGGYPQAVQDPDGPPSGIWTGPVQDPDGPGVQEVDGARPPAGPLSPCLSSEKDSVPSDDPPDDERTDGDLLQPETPNGYTNAADLLLRGIDLSSIDPRPRQIQQIRAGVAKVLAAGYPAATVDQYLQAKVKEARTVTYLLGAFTPERLLDLTHYTKSPTTNSVPPACDNCLRDNPAARLNLRFRVHHGTPCPTCHPAAQQHNRKATV